MVASLNSECNMSDLIKLNCPFCGGKLEIPINSNKVTCLYCGQDSLIPGLVSSQSACPICGDWYCPTLRLPNIYARPTSRASHPLKNIFVRSKPPRQLPHSPRKRNPSAFSSS